MSTGSAIEEKRFASVVSVSWKGIPLVLAAFFLSKSGIYFSFAMETLAVQVNQESESQLSNVEKHNRWYYRLSIFF